MTRTKRHTTGTTRWRGAARVVGVIALAAGSALTATTPVASAFPAGSFQGDQMRGRAFGASGAVVNPGLDPNSTADDTSVSIGEVAVQSLSCNPALGTFSTKAEDDLTTNLNLVGGITIPLPSTTALLAQAGELKQTGYATAEPSRADAYERSVVQSVNLLDGRIQAEAVQADAWSTHDATGYHHHSLALQNPNASPPIPNGYGETPGELSDPANSWNPRTGATFVNLRIDADGPGGQPPTPISATPEPNTRIALGGLGYVVLNEQKLAGTKYPNPTDPRFPKGVYSFSGVDVNAIHVYLFDDASTAVKESFAGYNGEVILAHAETRVQPAPGRLSGFAYGSRGTVNPFLLSGPQAIIGLPCGGTDGADRNRTQVATQVPAPSNAQGVTKLLTTGTMSSTVSGRVKFGNDTPFSKSVEDIQNVRLITATDGTSRVSADALHVVARTDGTPTSVTSSADGTSFVNLVVDPDGPGGQAPIVFSQTPPPNTTIALPGLGQLILNEQYCSDHPNSTKNNLNKTFPETCSSLRVGPPASNTNYNSLTTYAIHLKITVPDNPTGLPVGAEVFVGVAHSDVAF